MRCPGVLPMSASAELPLSGWTVSADQTPAAREAGTLLAALGASARPDEVSGLRLVRPGGGAFAAAGLGPDPAADWAASGAVWLTGRAAEPPLLPGGRVASRIGGALLAVQLLSRALGHEIVIDGRALLGERAALAGLRRRGPASPGGGTRLLPAADTAIALTLARPEDVAALPALLERDRVGAPWAAVRRWAARLPAEQVVDRASLLGIPAAALPAAAPARVPIYRIVGAGQRPWPPARPVVVDLTSMWAGPLAAHLLGRAGCRVVKVELNGRLDGARRGPAPFYDLLHAGHGAVTFDLRERAGRSGLQRLLGAADLVLESARPRALRQLGIGARDSPGSWLALRAYDAGGGWAERPGFGDDVAVAAGLAVLDRRARPLPVGDAIADPVAGACVAVAGLAALVGGGRWLVETSLFQALAGVTAVGEGVPATRQGEAWAVPTAGGLEPVARPRARGLAGRAAPPGADNDRLDTLLGW